ncbi:MAG: non-heme iron oxygenase ferredoxin subunit [Actinobacteria bacterium]|nr:non-heme iron oxygenase ferredoxin subunit [Actinomycetota bacterium]
MSTRVCAVSELRDDEPLRVELAEIDITVVRTGDEIFAIEDVCSHADFPLSDGDVEGCTIECALHGSRFDLRTGKPSGPPATVPVPVYPVSVVDGDVYIDVEND